MSSPASPPPVRFQPKLRYCHRRMSAPGSKQAISHPDAVMMERRGSQVRQGLWALLVLASLIVSLFVLWQLRGDIRTRSFHEDEAVAAP